MTPAQLIARRKDNPLSERVAGEAEVWKRSRFGWEKKRPGRVLRAALKQFTGCPDAPCSMRIEGIGAPKSQVAVSPGLTYPSHPFLGLTVRGKNTTSPGFFRR